MRKFLRALSELLPWLCLAGFMAVGVPLFICMPLWVDATYFDVCARNVFTGGVHYRDIFETNLPGMVWTHMLVRSQFGWSSEALRAVDLAVVGSSILLLASWLKRIGISRIGRAWFVCGAFFFYVFETEFIHCQRDSWMLLPTILAMHLRGRQLLRPDRATPTSLFWHAVLEGMLWACALWIKPHSTVPALFVWLVGARRLWGISRHKALVDLAGLLTGGILVGGVGIAWLMLTDTWPFMWDVLLNWNPEYYRWTPAEMEMRLSNLIMYFAPWSLVHYAALPLAIYSLVRARVWHFGAWPNLTQVRLDRAVLAALYLGWLAQAIFLQKVFHYTHAPVVLLAIAVVAAQRWPVAQIMIAWCLIGGALRYYEPTTEGLSWLGDFKAVKPFTYKQVVPRHKLINDEWRQVWRTCLVSGSSPAIKDELSFYSGINSAPTWVDLDEAKQYLQTLNLKDRELVCWDDTTHPLYLELNIQPGFRFMHVNTSLEFRSKRPIMREELIASGHKYVVSDVAVVNGLYGFFPLDAPPDKPLDLPIEFPCFCKEIYPWNQPIIKKCGRYWIHRVENPIGEIRIPYPVVFDKP